MGNTKCHNLCSACFNRDAKNSSRLTTVHICNKIWPECFDLDGKVSCRKGKAFRNPWAVVIYPQFDDCILTKCNDKGNEGYMLNLVMGQHSKNNLKNMVQMLKKHYWLDDYT